ncbi:MAG: MotA/TolQ/ExbB proton channel family protein [Candidatus Fermentibacter sp.]|nr:MotA/TolQ/ExbB proton channel family protein [Candidatus Fermentibacter sp.]
MRNILLAVLMLAAASWAQAPADTTAPAPVDTTTQIAEPVVEPVTPPADSAAVPAGEDIERPQNAAMDLKDLFIAGGIFMWPLLLSAIIGVAIGIERYIVLRKCKINQGTFLDQLGGYIRKGDHKGAEDLCDRTRGPVASILRAGLVRRDKGLEAVEKGIETAAQVEMSFLEKGLIVMASVVVVAPMLGFLGTVSGMINAFGAIAAAKNVEASLVASGIQEALITTAAGLMIAIPVQLAYNWYISIIGRYVIDMEEASSFLIDTLSDMELLKKL